MKSYLKRKLATILFRISQFDEFQNMVRSSRIHSKQEVINFKSKGKNQNLPLEILIINPQYISIGDDFSALYNLRIEAWDEYQGIKYSPEIIIGNNVGFNSDVHIGCINRIVIGNNVLLASRIYISDHIHGEITSESLKNIPKERPLFSKGPVIIEDNVWIGEGVCILPNVKIGENSIIGANSVITRDVPKNSVVVGIPGKVIRTL